MTAGPSRAEPAAGPGAWSPTGPAPGLAPGAAAATGSAAGAATGHAAGTEAGTPAAPGAGTGAWAAPGTGTGRLLGGILGDVDLAGDAPSVGADPALVERATRNFAATRYAGLDPPDAEVPVVLRVGEWVISGRIDAIFRHLDGEVEVVDWKTGRPAEPAAGGLDQLGIYAVALRELGELPEAGCLAAYCYLGGERPRIDARHLGRAELDEQARLLEATLAALGRGDYDRACGRPDCEACRRGARPPRPPAPEGGTADTAIRASPWGRS